MFFFILVFLFSKMIVSDMTVSPSLNPLDPNPPRPTQIKRNVPVWNAFELLEVEVAAGPLRSVFFFLLGLLPISLVLLLLLPGESGDAAVAPLAGRAGGPVKGRLVCVLLGMHLVVQEVAGELGAVLDLQLGNSRGD